MNDKDELLDFCEDLENKINASCLNDVEKVTADKVKQASEKLKTDKSDPVCGYTSDCLKNAPDLFFSHLSLVIRAFLVHGRVSQILLLSTLVPIVKDKLGDICASKNYRSIAISNLILKILDWVIIILFGSTLGLEDLQFAYQEKCSTFMCSWLVVETVSYFLRNNTEVFCCTMDMTKAFDLVKFSVLFKKLVEKNLPLIFIRLLVFMYVNQTANVRWNGDISEQFTILNGVKQGRLG